MKSSSLTDVELSSLNDDDVAAIAEMDADIAEAKADEAKADAEWETIQNLPTPPAAPASTPNYPQINGMPNQVPNLTLPPAAPNDKDEAEWELLATNSLFEMRVATPISTEAPIKTDSHSDEKSQTTEFKSAAAAAKDEKQQHVPVSLPINKKVNQIKAEPPIAEPTETLSFDVNVHLGLLKKIKRAYFDHALWMKAAGKPGAAAHFKAGVAALDAALASPKPTAKRLRTRDANKIDRTVDNMMMFADKVSRQFSLFGSRQMDLMFTADEEHETLHPARTNPRRTR